jgi:hypothetical protein
MAGLMNNDSLQFFLAHIFQVCSCCRGFFRGLRKCVSTWSQSAVSEAETEQTRQPIWCTRAQINQVPPKVHNHNATMMLTISRRRRGDQE